MTKTTRSAEFLQLLAESDPNECWPWPHADNGYGYGRIRWHGDQAIWLAHRLSYALSVEPIGDGLQIDHVCHSADPDCVDWATCPHRACVNPGHLEAVTGSVNQSRQKQHGPVRYSKSHCTNGHEFTPENSYFDPAGIRSCRTCRRDAKRRYRVGRKGAQPD